MKTQLCSSCGASEKLLANNSAWMCGQRSILAIAAAALLFAQGCSSLPPPAEVSRMMERVQNPPLTPPPGKSLVYFHRALSPIKVYYTSGWDGTNFLADLGNGHSLAYICEPGKHIFTSRCVAQVSVIEANLLPDKIYDFVAGLEYLSLKPITRNSKERPLVSQWMTNAVWVTRGLGAKNYAESRQEMNNELIRDFTTGPKQKRLLYLAPDDCR